MAKVLGKVTGSMNDPRGPDVLHRIAVPAAWLDEGSVIELELPRLLTCGACEGGGCGACGQSGAITLRGRKEPTELIEVTLPSRAPTQSEAPRSGRRSLMLRIPERGGVAEEGSGLPRGMLYLTVQEAVEPSPGVARLGPPSSAQRPTTSAPPVAERPAPAAERPASPVPRAQIAEETRPAAAPPTPAAQPARRRRDRTVWLVAIVVAAWIAALLGLRLLGWG